MCSLVLFVLNVATPTQIYTYGHTLALPDPLPIYRRPAIGFALRGGVHFVPLALAGRDVEHPLDPACSCTFEHGLLFFDQAFVIQMAMAIDEHQPAERKSTRLHSSQ